MSNGPPSSLPKILVAGVGPVPPEATERLFAPGLRVWGIANSLASVGHPVRLATVQFSGAPLEKLSVRDLHTFDSAKNHTDLPAPREVALGKEGLSRALSREAEDFGARAAIGCSDLINRELGLIESDLPIWCDFFGDPMAERQMLARLHKSDAGLADQWKTLVPALTRGDRFSGCSRYQLGAICGELAAVGRMNSLTADEQLVYLLRPWISPVQSDTKSGPLVRGVLLPTDDLLAIHTGGFNTWVDVETLFAALEIAMSRNPQLHYATTGGAIPGHNEDSFRRFEELVNGSPNASRYHFLGWLPLGKVNAAIAEGDFAINVDRSCPEGWLGTRNRVMDWLLQFRPVISTVGCELVQDLADRGFIAGVPQGAPEEIAKAIDEVIEGCSPAVTGVVAGSEYLKREYSPDVCLRPLLDWARDPQPASDLQSWRRGEARPPELWTQARAQANRIADAQDSANELALLKLRMSALEGSRLVRAALWLREKLQGGGSPPAR